MTTQQAIFNALLDPAQPPPSGLATWNGSDPAARFAVYRNNVVVSLIDALADTFPVTQKLVGEQFFRAMARVFVIGEPPRSRVLAYYGESFPAFVERFPPAAPVPYLADVARLEMARVRSFHAADVALLSADAYTQALANEDALPDLLIGLHPSLRLVQSKYAVVSLWAAHQGLADISTIDPFTPENALIIRPQFNVDVIRLNSDASQFVGWLLQGVTLGAAVEHVCLARAEFDLAGTLGLLIRAHAITSMADKKENLT